MLHVVVRTGLLALVTALALLVTSCASTENESVAEKIERGMVDSDRFDWRCIRYGGLDYGIDYECISSAGTRYLQCDERTCFNEARTIIVRLDD